MLNEQRLDNLYWLEASQEEVMTEGANLDVRRIFVAHRKELKKGCKEVRKAYKQGDYDTAKKKIKDLKKTIDDMTKSIDIAAQSSGVGSWLFSLVTGNVMFIGRTLIASLFGPIGKTIMIYNLCLKRLRAIVDSCKREDRDANLKDFNGYISGIRARVAEYKKVLDDFEKYIGKEESITKSNIK